MTTTIKQIPYNDYLKAEHKNIGKDKLHKVYAWQLLTVIRFQDAKDKLRSYIKNNLKYCDLTHKTRFDIIKNLDLQRFAWSKEYLKHYTELQEFMRGL